MFRKRIKKEFPPNTFIPKPARMAAIIQLCLAFTLIVWSGSLPFMGELFAFKAKALLYQNVMGDKSLHISGDKDKMERNKERFLLLPKEHQARYQQHYETLQAKSDTTFSTKLWRSIKIVAFELPSFEQAWIFFSIVIAIMLLLKVDGAVQAAWLLPVIALCYAFDNHWHGNKAPVSPDMQLFPSEEVIVSNYLKKPLSESIFDQQEELRQGWQLYLVQDWAHEQPSSDPILFTKQVEDGEYAFNLARLDRLIESPEMPEIFFFQKQESTILLVIYILWNFFFAWIVKSSPKNFGQRHGQGQKS